MRTTLRILLPLLLLTSSLSADAIKPEKQDFGNISRYAQQNAALQATPQKDCAVVFIGNSITDFWVNKHEAFFTVNAFVGRGISGQTSAQMLLRFREDVVNLNPSIVVINAGTNDCAENIDPYNEVITFGNIVSMADIARANGITVVLASLLPAANFYWNPQITDAPERIQALNNRLKAYAEANGIPYIDYHSALIADDGKALDPAYTTDGVHPTLAGYTIMEALALDVLRPLLAQP